MCCWAYVTGTIGDTANGLITNHSHSDNTGVGITVKQISTSDYRISCNTGIGNNRTFCTYYGTTNIKNAWHHLCLTYSKSKKQLKLWVDGKVEYTLDNYVNAFKADYIDIFNWSTTYYTSGEYRPTCKLNDVRVYDHCLSAREIKEISKGLCLHYKLGGVDGYFGGRNLVPNSYRLNGQWSAAGNYAGTTTVVADQNARCGYHIESKCTTAGSGPHYPIFTKSSDKIGKTYTWSFEAKCSTSKTGTVGHECNGTKTITLTTTWTKYTHTWTFTDSQYHSFVFYPGFAVGDILYIRDFKIEEGTKATSWTPAPSDNPALYDTTLYDTSGYLSTAIPSGTIGYSSDSPRYDGSYVFSDASHFKLTQTLVSPSQFTCSFWVKPTSLGGYAIVTSNYNNPSSGFWIAVNCEGSGLWFYNGSYARSNKGLLTLNTWYHACLVFKDGVFTWYQNGEAAGTTDLSSKSKTLGIADTIGIGNSYTGSSWNTKFNGNISDFRMYATALSAADVKELYNTPISLTNTGVLMTQGEFKEV